MPADVAVITAIYDRYDTLKPVLPQAGAGTVDWLLATDEPPSDDLGWRVLHIPRPGLHPNRAAKAPKLRPWEYTSAPASVWIDASYRIISGDFVSQVMAAADPIAQFPHWNDCIYAEALDSVTPPAKQEQYAGEPILAQVQHYRDTGHPGHWGCWCTSVIGRVHTSAVRELGEAWAREINQWSFQDQVSEPVALRACGLRPAPLPAGQLTLAMPWESPRLAVPEEGMVPWLSYEGSSRHC